ncbi:MAG: hypothetical protein KGK30_04585, partial [Elusimicrobia bacterium]|nr:hypothetical protein [Elusimicrobiota bacterium]
MGMRMVWMLSLAAALAGVSSPAMAQSRATEAGSAPTAAPASSPATGSPASLPPAGMENPASGVGTGIARPPSAGQVPLAGAAAVGAPGAPEAAPAGTVVGAPSMAPGRSALPGQEALSGRKAAPAAALPGARSVHGRAASGQLQGLSAGTTAGHGGHKAAPPSAESAEQAFQRTYDKAAAALPSIGGQPSWPAVYGRTQSLWSRVRQLSVELAATTSPRDQPGIYRQAIEQATKAALKKEVSPEQAAAMTRSVLAVAWTRAPEAAARLLGEAYAAALPGRDPGAIDRSFSALKAWKRLLRGADSRPLVRGFSLADFRSSVEAARAQAAARRLGPDAVPPLPRFSLEGDELVLLSDLPGLAGGGAPPPALIPGAALPRPLVGAAVAPPALPEAATVDGLWQRARFLFKDYRGAGRSAPAAAWAAGSFAALAAAHSAWRRLEDFAERALGRLFPGRVDLGLGHVLTSGDRDVARLAPLGRDSETR